MNLAIVYRSQTGHTKTYAKWLAESLGCDAMPYSQRDYVEYNAIDTLVYCTWIHAASLKGGTWLKDIMAHYPAIQVVVLFSGATPMPGSDQTAQDELEAAFRRTFPESEYPDLPHFYCRGGFDFEKLGAADKMIMRLFFSMEEKNADGPKTKEMLDAMRSSFDGTEREYLNPLLEYLALRERQLSQS